MTKHIYVRAADRSVWEDAENYADDAGISLSELTTVALRHLMRTATVQRAQAVLVTPSQPPDSHWGLAALSQQG